MVFFGFEDNGDTITVNKVLILIVLDGILWVFSKFEDNGDTIVLILIVLDGILWESI